MKDFKNLFGGLCMLCLAAKATEVHEIIPRSLGGKRENGNAVPLCFACHRRVTQDARWNEILLARLNLI